MEQKIIKAVLCSRDHWELVHPHMRDSDITPEGMIVWNRIKEYYARDKAAKFVDFELITNSILRKYRDNHKHLEMLKIYLQQVDLTDISGINIVEEVLSYKKSVVSMQLAESLMSNNEEESQDLIDTLQSLNLAIDLDLGVEEVYQGMDLGELLSAFSEDNLIRIAPKSLNTRLGGGALRGHHILLAAMPETGKSLFAIHMTHGFVQQGLKVLYIGNEDPIVSLILRFLCNLTNMTKAQLLEHTDYGMGLAISRGYENVVFVGLSPGTLPEIRSLIVKHKPDVLIVDQLRNVQVKTENRTNQLEAVARGMRDFARQYNLLSISVTQAAESARDHRILNMGDIDGSNIGMPGACDVMVMIGVDPAYYDLDHRHITLAKNKLTGNHDNWVVGIDKFTSRVIDPSEFIKNKTLTLKEITSEQRTDT